MCFMSMSGSLSPVSVVYYNQSLDSSIKVVALGKDWLHFHLAVSFQPNSLNLQPICSSPGLVGLPD